MASQATAYPGPGLLPLHQLLERPPALVQGFVHPWFAVGVKQIKSHKHDRSGLAHLRRDPLASQPRLQGSKWQRTVATPREDLTVQHQRFSKAGERLDNLREAGSHILP